MTKKQKAEGQWKVLRGVPIDTLAAVLEEWTGRGWNVVTILGPQGNVAVVLQRFLVL